jgi:hypothetical protein
MARCPVCESPRVVIVVAPRRRAFCTVCGARWVQRGSEQRRVHRGPTVRRLPADRADREA